MEVDYFLYKIDCKFVITSESVNPELLTNKLGLMPTRCAKLGELRLSSKHGSEAYPWPHNFWELSSKQIVSNEESIIDQISELANILMPKVSIITKLKEDPLLEISFWISIETDDSGYSLELSKDNLEFINLVANRVNILFHVNNILNID